MNRTGAERAEAMKARTKAFALRVIRFCRSLPKSEETRIIKRQLLRSATSVAANYRAACRARSRREFASKMSIVLEEADETEFWLELLIEADLVDADRTRDLLNEAGELVAIFAAARHTASRPQE
ncbi:four helix bundle protein [Rubrivirga sp.]|uniref:four helix bundle protein n=1 Tax=Rubrivirga sp. TaxID=1885344 RepID=UPI003C7895B9